MLQSWGRVRACQAEASNPAAAALGSDEFPYWPEGSDVSAVLTSLNRHPPSKLAVRPGWLRTPRFGSPLPDAQPTGPRSLTPAVAALAPVTTTASPSTAPAIAATAPIIDLCTIS